MTTIPNLVREYVGRLQGNCNETLNTLDANGIIPKSDVSLWQKLERDIQFDDELSLSILDDFGDVVNLNTCSDDIFSSRLRFTFKKDITDNCVRFFFSKSLSILFSDDRLLQNTRRVLVAESKCSFRTETCIFAPWNNFDEILPNLLLDENEFNVAPRRYVRDLSGGKVPLTIGESLLIGNADETCPTFLAWRKEATSRLLLTLVNEVWLENGEIKVLISGPRKVTAVYSLKNDVSFSVATEVARWVYASGRDIDVRYTLFTYELAREFPEDSNFSDNFYKYGPKALDIAKTSFSTYVKETSKDTLKSLGDLRKTLNEDVAKITSQAKDFLTSMWRDFAFAVTVIIGRISLSILKPDLAGNIYIFYLMIFTAIFLFISCISNLFINNRFMCITKENRKIWKNKLYGFLSDAELKSLADEPINQAESIYNKIAIFGFISYLLVSVVIIFLAFTSVENKNIISINGVPIMNISLDSFKY
ncbi:hypothetical protein [Acetobacter ascendens]|uniref:Uncharacterized protein n=1 Tax=Acetobacter ascendens TaxID=481146 RepID=A0A1Y0V0S8_9PROT|nr:hypothetical protein [Acetobacter ascendens]ARW11750.1 hypothetical protein S101447_02712 [Acetobacter ascendens]